MRIYADFLIFVKTLHKKQTDEMMRIFIKVILLQEAEIEGQLFIFEKCKSHDVMDPGKESHLPTN